MNAEHVGLSSSGDSQLQGTWYVITLTQHQYLCCVINSF